MKKILLSAAAVAATLSLQAAVPEGNLTVVGLSDEGIVLPLGERDEDDIDEGLWRWRNDAVNVTKESGTFTLTAADGFKLGFDAGNEFGMTNEISDSMTQTYLAVDGPAVNFTLTPDEYQIIVAVFEDLDGSMGRDTWSISIKSNTIKETDENYYLLGFDGNTDPMAANRFVRTAEDDGEGGVFYMYSIPKIYLGSCPEGFTVFDSASGASYGAAGSEVTADMPMAFLTADGGTVKSGLSAGYYTVNFTPMGAMNMVAFLECENQTPVDELSYTLTGVNGKDVDFVRTTVKEEYTDEETGDTEVYESVSYTIENLELNGEPCRLLVKGSDELTYFGYNDDAAAFLPNDLNADMPFSSLVTFGEEINCTLPAGKYNVTLSIMGTTGALIGFENAANNAVGEVEVSDAAPVYYNLQGARVARPEKGLVIEVRGAKARKVVL